MSDEDRTVEQLKSELRELRQRIADLEPSTGAFNRMEVASAADEQRFRLLYERAPLSYQSLDEKGNFIEINRAWLDTLGYEREEVIGRNFGDFLHPDWVNHFKENFPRFKAVGEVLGVEFEMLKKDGTSILVSFHGKIGRDLQGRFQQTHCIFQDITKHRLLEEALRESESRFRALFENSPVAYQSLDLEGRYIDLNQKLCDLIGYQPEELLGRSFGDLWSEATRALFPEVFEAFKTYRQVGSELHLISKDGRALDVILEGRVQEDSDGNFMRTHCILTDITQRKRAEEALRESEQHFRTLANSGKAMIWTSGVDKLCDYFNRPWLEFTGRTLEQEIGEGWVEGVHSDDLARCLEIYVRAFDRRETFSMAYRLRRHDGEYRWIQDDGTPRYDSHGKFLGYIGHCLDISDQKREQEERQRLQVQLHQVQKIEAVGRLAGGVAHDFNNMLGVIIGHTELALDQVNPSESIHYDLQEIYKAAHRSADLTRQLLAFARKQTASPQILDLNDTVSSMIKMLKRLIGENIDLAWIPGHDLWSVKIDPSQVDQILANLAVNARDAIDGVGSVTIEASNEVLDDAYCAGRAGFVPGEYVMLAVSDTGTGMSQEVLDHIFEPFFTTKETGKGTGLGLATVYGIVKQNAGGINVYSEPAQGTTFKIYLPRFRGEVVRISEPPTEKLPGGTETVLVVEDEEAILNLGKRMLGRLGYKVLTAGTPSQAIRLVQDSTENIRLLITDVIMPEMNGLELAERLTTMKPGLKCLFMSGYTANVIAHHGVLDKGIIFIQKPFSLKSMAEKTREALGNQSVVTLP